MDGKISQELCTEGKKVKNEMYLHFNMLLCRHFKTKAKKKKNIKF